jgi:hypothetical protein
MRSADPEREAIGVVPGMVLLPVLALVLLVSSVKLWLHRRT